MEVNSENQIVETIGKDIFHWMVNEFNKETRLQDVPGEILDHVQSVDITVRDFSQDRHAIIAIALITFSYRLANKVQQPRYGSNDILLLKVLARNERARRQGKKLSDNRLWDAPLYELVAGDVGERIRATRFMTNPA